MVHTTREAWSDAAPDQLSQSTMEENMVRVLQGATKGAELRHRAITLTNLVSRGKTAFESLPEEDLHFRGNTSPPHMGKSVSGGTTNKLAI